MNEEINTRPWSLETARPPTFAQVNAEHAREASLILVKWTAGIEKAIQFGDYGEMSSQDIADWEAALKRLSPIIDIMDRIYSRNKNILNENWKRNHG